MLALTNIVAAFRRSQMRRAAIRDLQSLSREQLSDVGIPPDRFGDVIDAMLARPQPLETSRRVTPELKGAEASRASDLGLHSLEASGQSH